MVVRVVYQLIKKRSTREGIHVINPGNNSDSQSCINGIHLLITFNEYPVQQHHRWSGAFPASKDDARKQDTDARGLLHPSRERSAQTEVRSAWIGPD